MTDSEIRTEFIKQDYDKKELDYVNSVVRAGNLIESKANPPANAAEKDILADLKNFLLMWAIEFKNAATKEGQADAFDLMAGALETAYFVGRDGTGKYDIE